MFDVLNDSLVNEQWDKNNFLIINEKNTDNNRCAIYFSSHGIYFPETKKNFIEVIIKKDYYEWYSTRVPNCSKHIFIRDIKKQFYVEGINSRINSIDLLLDFLKIETLGYEVYTVGSSAGGYIAAIVGAMLGAKLVFDFAGKFSLKDDFAYPTKEKLLEHENDFSYSKYYNITCLLKEKHVDIIYVCPTLSDEDLVQENLINDNVNIIRILFRVKEHGVCMYPFNLTRFMGMSPDEIKKYSNVNRNLWTRHEFSKKLLGIWSTRLMELKYYRVKVIKGIAKRVGRLKSHD